MAKKPITIQLEPDLIDEIDQAAKHIETSRQEWIAAACRGALGPVAEPARRPETPDFIRDGGMAPPSSYRQSVPGPNVEKVRSSSQAKRNVKPMPKRTR